VETETFFIKLICTNVASQYDYDGLDNLHATAQSKKKNSYLKVIEA
jgi:hypothetical protein